MGCGLRVKSSMTSNSIKKDTNNQINMAFSTSDQDSVYAERIKRTITNDYLEYRKPVKK